MCLLTLPQLKQKYPQFIDYLWKQCMKIK
jgi:hypothetical protein